MPPKTIKKAIKDELEDLSKEDFEKFKSQLVDRREEPRVRRNRVEGKDFLVVADVLVSTFTEQGALQVTVELLREIDCNHVAERLVKETSGQSSDGGCNDTARPSGGATGVNTKADNEHFVDKHKVELIQRVSNIAPILDELLYHKVIQEETYNKIRALPTSQEKMRELYCGGLQAGTACKDVFFKLLEEKERFLMDDLKKKN